MKVEITCDQEASEDQNIFPLLCLQQRQFMIYGLLKTSIKALTTNPEVLHHLPQQM